MLTSGINFLNYKKKVKDEKIKKHLIDLINMGRERFFVYNHKDKTCYDLEFCCDNGSQIQINFEQL